MQLLFRDARLAVFDKPSGLLVHRGGWADDLDVAMARARDALGAYVHPIHRLDRGTSGALVFALDAATARELSEAFEQGLVEKTYVALVRGLAPEEAYVDHPIPRREDGPRVEARTRVRRLEAIAGFSLVEARPETGRLHQVRRHLKHLSHPVIGDANYGKGALNRDVRARFGLARLALHALAIRLPDAFGAQTVVAPLPSDLRAPLLAMGFGLRALDAAIADESR